MLDIEVDTTKTQEPQIHPDMTVMPASSISSPSMSVPIPTPQQGPRPLPTPTMMTPAPPASTNNGSSENGNLDDPQIKPVQESNSIRRKKSQRGDRNVT